MIGAKESRTRGVCMHCEQPAVLSRRQDGTSWRALMWCPTCRRVAHAGDSFVRIADISNLPEVAIGD
jgi:hypothetical protein